MLLNQAFPVPLSDKTGWPWTEEYPKLPDTMPSGSPWPRISIVTPSYNQGQFLEETIRSVLMQGYPNLEYIIIDGGSTDNSLKIIRKYKPWLSYWVSEPDRGQSHAINKGFERCTGEIFAWINSDDVYTPNTLRTCALSFCKDQNIKIIFGDIRMIDTFGKEIMTWSPPEYSFESTIINNNIPQPTVFMHRKVFESMGLLDERLHFALDRDYWSRIAWAGYQFTYINAVLANFRIHNLSKTTTQVKNFYEEHLIIFERLFQKHTRGDAGTKILKNKAYSTTYLLLAHYYRSSGERPLMFKNWLLAIRYHSGIALRKDNLYSFLPLLIPTAAYPVFRSLWRGLKRFKVFVFALAQQ